MKRKPIKPICSEMDAGLEASLARARGALYMERLQKAAAAACAAVRAAVASRRVNRRRKKTSVGAPLVGAQPVPRFLVKQGKGKPAR